jgi:hypothetical protein
MRNVRIFVDDRQDVEDVEDEQDDRPHDDDLEGGKGATRVFDENLHES